MAKSDTSLMEIFRFSANLQFRHPNLDPEEISAGLSLKPKVMWKRGQERTSPDGTKLGGVYRLTYWSAVAKEGEDAELFKVLDSDLSHLEQRREFVNEFVSTGGTIDYFIGWFASERSGGLAIPPSLLRRLGDLQIFLSLDVYSWDGEETETSSPQPDGANDEPAPSET